MLGLRPRPRDGGGAWAAAPGVPRRGRAQGRWPVWWPCLPLLRGRMRVVPRCLGGGVLATARQPASWRSRTPQAGLRVPVFPGRPRRPPLGTDASGARSRPPSPLQSRGAPVSRPGLTCRPRPICPVGDRPGGPAVTWQGRTLNSDVLRSHPLTDFQPKSTSSRKAFYVTSL